MDYSFLPFLIQETLYIVDKPTTETSTVADKQGHTTTPQRQVSTAETASSTDKVLFVILENEFLHPDERKLILDLVTATHIPYEQVSRQTLAQYKPQVLNYAHYFLIFTRQKPAFILGEKYSLFEKDQKKMIWSDTLADLLADKQKKLQLWTAMKKMFGLV